MSSTDTAATDTSFRFRIDPEVFAQLPNACFGVVLARGLDNATAVPAVESLLEEAVAARAAALEGVKVKEIDAVAPYREAFRTLGINPNKFMCSIEALLTRIGKGHGMPRINPAVDLGNAVSLRHALPIGAHDAATTGGLEELRFAREGDTFVPFGATEAEAVDSGELVYVANGAVRTRRWTWRQSEVGKITEQTTSVFFPIDGFAGVNDDAVRAAQAELVERLRADLGCDVAEGWADAEHPEVDLP